MYGAQLGSSRRTFRKPRVRPSRILRNS
jgi:hypothetical protein